MGIVRGAAADAIEDTEALYDDDPPTVGCREWSDHAIPARDVPGTPEWLRARGRETEVPRRAYIVTSLVE
jgi:hypothetical protein